MDFNITQDEIKEEERFKNIVSELSDLETRIQAIENSS